MDGWMEGWIDGRGGKGTLLCVLKGREEGGAVDAGLVLDDELNPFLTLCYALF